MPTRTEDSPYWRPRPGDKVLYHGRKWHVCSTRGDWLRIEYHGYYTAVPVSAVQKTSA